MMRNGHNVITEADRNPVAMNLGTLGHALGHRVVESILAAHRAAAELDQCDTAEQLVDRYHAHYREMVPC